MGKEVISKKGFKQKAAHKHVKTRTPYKVVEHYEKDFKHDFAKRIGDMANGVLTHAAKELNVKNPSK